MSALDDAAEANRGLWRDRADAAVADVEHGPSFRAKASAARIGTTVGDDKLAHFAGLTPPSIVSTFEVRAAATGPAEAEAAMYGNGVWGPRRAAIEHALDAYKSAVYGTLDLPGQVGQPPYGEWRLVYEPGVAGRVPVVLPHNSASRYAPSGTVDMPALVGDVVAWEGRGDLATCERLDQSSPDSGTWPRLLATENRDSAYEDDLIEVVLRDGERPLDDVVEIRIDEPAFLRRARSYAVAVASGLGRLEMEAGDAAYGLIDDVVGAKVRPVP